MLLLFISSQERSILLNHIGIKHDKYGTMYDTLSGGKIIFNAVGKPDGAEKWKANGADVIISMTDGINGEIVILNDVIMPRPRISVLDVLCKKKEVSVFYGLLVRGDIDKVVTAATSDVAKICFTKNRCVAIAPSMSRHLTDAVKFDQYTVIVPTNEAIRRNFDGKVAVARLSDNLDQLRNFLQEYVFLGSVGNPNAEKEIGYSLSESHSVITTTVGIGGERILTNADGHTMRVKERIPVKEGNVIIVE